MFSKLFPSKSKFQILSLFTLLVMFLGSLPSMPVHAEAPASLPASNAVFSWAKGMGGTGMDAGRGIAIDPNGNVYTMGAFEGTVDFDTGPGVANLTASNSAFFIMKTDNNGNFLWVKGIKSEPIMLGGIGTGGILDVDANGNAYATGRFSGTVDFDPSPGVFEMTGGGGFALKLDSNGNFVWAKNIGGNGRSIVIDPSGNVYTTGEFNGTVDFDPGPGTSELTGSSDVFISKLDGNGNFVWAKSVEGSSVSSIALDSNNNVLTTGNYYGTVDFDPGPGTFNLSPGDIYILKLDSNGNFVWAKNVGPSGIAFAGGISIDSNNNVLTTGFFLGTGDFDPGPGEFTLTADSDTGTIYISKLDSNGNFVWARNMGGGVGSSYSIATDSNGDIYTTGNFSNTGDFDPGAGVFNLTSAGDYDVFVSKLDGNGNFVWARKLGGSGSDMSFSLAVDANHNAFATGEFSDTADFDPGTGISNLVSNGSWDIFIAKLEEDIIPPAVTSITRAGASPASGSSVDFTVTFSETVTGVSGSDFSLTTSGLTGASVTGVSGSGNVYTVTASTGTGNGSLRLDIPDTASITDTAGNPLSNLPFTGETYSIVRNQTFEDVPTTYWAWQYIERLYIAGITGGCSTSPLNYCPTSPVTRAQMAIFLEKGMHGPSFSPPNVPATFTDTSGHWAEDWIEALKNDGITSGCGAGIYCPDDSVTRAQMAVFLLKAKHGSSFAPPAATGVFTDVATTYWAAAWIEQLAAEGITSGCAAGLYCPENAVTRDQMAVFLVKAFNLP